jgi:peptidyl-prolyl cis-trans isomerase B (cyclophilin B)
MTEIDLDNVDLATLEATVNTDKGAMVVGFYPNEAPGHVLNFARLAQNGFYDGLAFHRVVRNFMIQGGCPHTRDGAKGTPGTGGPGHTVPAEFSSLPHKRGVLSMARSQDPNSAGSQFFVVHAEHAAFLDGKYTVFGYLKEGHDVLDAIANVECEFGSGGERSRPIERIGIQSVSLAVAEPAAGGAEEGVEA